MFVPMIHLPCAATVGSGALAGDCCRDSWSFGSCRGCRRRVEDHRGTGLCDMDLCWECCPSVGLHDMDPLQRGHQIAGPGTAGL
jgi:hypothetical protein